MKLVPFVQQDIKQELICLCHFCWNLCALSQLETKRFQQTTDQIYLSLDVSNNHKPKVRGSISLTKGTTKLCHFCTTLDISSASCICVNDACKHCELSKSLYEKSILGAAYVWHTKRWLQEKSCIFYCYCNQIFPPASVIQPNKMENAHLEVFTKSLTLSRFLKYVENM